MPMFRIIYASTGSAKMTPKEEWSRMDKRYSCAEEGKAKCRELTESHRDYDYSSGKYVSRYVFQIQVIPENEDFDTREAAKIAAGDYELLPQIWQNYAHFFAFYDKESKLISFYENERAAMNDKRSTLKPTRFWDRYIGQNDMFAAMHEAGMLSGEFELKFATTRSEIRRVYENGPQSCMSGEASQYYSSDVHPVEAYASPDLALAYLAIIEEDGEETIVSRSLCNVTNMGYVRIYGDIDRMRTFLEKAGYKENSYCLGGARVLKIFGKRRDQVDDSYVMAPYLDGNCTRMELKDPTDEYMVVIKEPLIVSGSTSGYYAIR